MHLSTLQATNGDFWSSNYKSNRALLWRDNKTTTMKMKSKDSVNHESRTDIAFLKLKSRQIK